MSDTIWFRTGEATVFSSEGQGTDAMPEILIGSVKGPAGNAFATLMGQTEGHTRMFAIRACNQQVRPATLMVPKVTIKSSAYVNLFGGPFGVTQFAAVPVAHKRLDGLAQRLVAAANDFLSTVVPQLPTTYKGL